MICKGVVKDKLGDKVSVSVKRDGACGENCASCSGCSGKFISIDAICYFEVDIGDTVVLSTPTKLILLLMALLFLLPVLLPVVAYVLIMQIDSVLASVVSVSLLVFCVMIIYFLSKNKSLLTNITPVVKEVLDKK